MALSPRVYYLFPAYPVLFAAGSVAWERWLAGVRAQWIKPVYVTLMVLMGALLAPTLIPLLPPETYIRYAAATHLQQPRIENHRLGPLPQLFADQFGWEEMAATVAGAYNSLPPDVRAKTAIFGAELRAGRRHRSFRAEVRYSRRQRHQRTPELLSVGPARLHRREHDRDGRTAGAAG